MVCQPASVTYPCFIQTLGYKMATQAANWKFILANSSDLSIIGELTNARNKSVDFALNKPGTARFQMSLVDDMAVYINEEITCILAYRNGVCLWSGPVWTISESLPDDIIDVGCVGWFQELNEARELHTAPTYTDMDAGEIAFALIDLINDQDPATPLRIVKGAKMDSQTRTRTYQVGQKVGPLIQELSDIEAGFDFYIDPLTRELNILYNEVKYGTSLYGIGTDRPEAVFGLNWGPENLQSLKRESDTSRLRNRIFAKGKFGTVESDDYVSQGIYGVFEETIVLSDVGDELILGAYANATVLFRSQPQRIISIVPAQFSNNTDNVPEPFVEYDIGDIIYIGAKRGRVQIEHQAMRVFGITVNIDEEGNEVATNIQTRYS
jgi:hypothetical protein